MKEQNFTMSKANNFTFAKAKTSPNDTECQIISFHGANADGADILKAKFNKNVVPYGTFTTSVLGKGQQSFVQFLFSFH